MNLDLERDGFENNPPYFHAIVGEVKSPEAQEEKVIAYGLYYYTYSTWKGKGIHLEDFFVTPKYRHQGVGTRILKMLAKVRVIFHIQYLFRSRLQS